MTTTTLPNPLPGDDFPSDDCAGGPAVVDGHAAGVYTKVDALQSGDTLDLCFRLDGGGLHQGGKVSVSTGGGAPATPSVDSQGDACTNAPGDTDALPDPLLFTEIGDPADPTTHVTVLVDVATVGDEVWLCLNVDDTVKSRVVVPLPDLADLPGVSVALDKAEPHDPGPRPWPAVPSAACENSLTGTKASLVNTTAGPAHLWLTGWRESDERVHLCVRTGGAANLGGQLPLDTSGVPGLEPVVDVSLSDFTPCTLNVFTIGSGASEVSVRRSPSTDPASVCVTVGGGLGVRLTLGASGSPGVPAVTWNPDPGTPG